ncbi:MAG: FAD/NAD(P)-binding oxidoreductase [candidate division KSB1 bacterium]|nr:FAD/NAD(P)-binding oxidoreductase [candidate division KSB1 bacterium]
MKKIVILGAGTGGTIMANKLSQQLPKNDWKITIVDKDNKHIYQPGLLFIPFNIYSCNDIIKPRRDYLPKDVELILSGIDVIEADKNQVKLENNKVLPYDYLIIATGTQLKPDETEGLADGGAWYQNIFDFYTFEGACQLQKFLKHWKGGHLALNITEMPIKCPVAPLEFMFLADWWFTEQGMRDKVDLTLVTPLPGAFTKPKAAKFLGDFLDQKNINLISEFSTGSVDTSKNQLVSFDDQKVDYDLLVTIPTNMGDDSIERSGLGDELQFVPTHKHTLQSKNHENIFVIGDATDLPASKAGSVAHFEAEVLTENMIRHIDGMPLQEDFDGHANCFIESGFGKGLLIDFNYDIEPLPGKFPLPGIGPFSLLQETKANHWGKMMFRWIYWNILLRGSELPIQARMNMAGKMR